MRKPDYILIFLIGIFTFFGFLMLSSASAPFATVKFGDSYYFVKNQFLHGFLPGIFLFWILSRVDYRFLKSHSNKILAGSIFLLLLVFIPGIGAEFGTARSWINVFGLFAFQPSEIAKLGIIIFFAAWLEYRAINHKNEEKKTLVSFLIILGIISGLILMQPDMGTMSILALIAIVIYFTSGAPVYYFAGIGGVAAIGFYILVKIAPYRTARFTAFLDPAADPQGAGYHIMQALLAIGSGRFFGLGFGHSRQKFQYLPEVSADSIFAVIGEELGFLFSAFFIVLLVYFLIRGIKIAYSAPDLFGKFLAIGIVSWIVLQSFINIGAMLSILPLTGVPLPFISYGGTALLAVLAASGILVNISRWSK